MGFKVIIAVLASLGFAVASPAPAVFAPVQFIEGVVPLENFVEPPPCTVDSHNDTELDFSGIPGDRYRWKQGIHMQIDGGFSEQQKHVINNALYELHTLMCVPVLLIPSDARPTGDYVFIQRGGGGSGCYSAVGKRGGRQILNLDPAGCVQHHIVMHETIHALGFHHEQTRPDRDQYVRILYENISQNARHNFDKDTNSLTFNVPYDYNSIMHYGSHAFSHNGRPTIQAHNGHDVGDKARLTDMDKAKLHRMYGC